MKFLEKNLEDLIYENANTEEGQKLLEERGLDLRGRTYRQVSMGKYGIADLINIFASTERIQKGFSVHHLIVDIIELKKDIVNVDTLLQAVGYKKAVDEYLDGYCAKAWDDYEVRVTLIGQKLETSSNFVFLLNELDWVKVYTYSYSIKGLMFTDESGRWYKKDALDKEIIHKITHPRKKELADIFRK